MTEKDDNKPRSPFWILLWTGFVLSVVSAVVDHDADYVLGAGIDCRAWKKDLSSLRKIDKELWR